MSEYFNATEFAAMWRERNEFGKGWKRLPDEYELLDEECRRDRMYPNLAGWGTEIPTSRHTLPAMPAFPDHK